MNDIVYVQDGKIIIKQFIPGIYKVRFNDEDLFIELTEDGKIIFYEVLTSEDIERICRYLVKCRE